MPNTSVTTYGLPSDSQLENGGAADKQQRVQQQIQMRLAEKSTLPRQNGSSTHYAMSDYGGSSTTKYNTYNPNFSSKSSYMYTSSSKAMGPRATVKRDFSSRSAAPDISQFQRMSMGVGGGGGGGYYQEGIQMGGYQGVVRQPSRMDHDAISMHSVKNLSSVNPWMMDGSDAGSLISERDATYARHTQSAANGFSSQMSQVRQGGGAISQQSIRTTLPRGAGMMGGGAENFQQQLSFKGPAHRTISRITNRNRTSVGSMSGNLMTSSASNMGGGDRVDRGFMSGSQSNLAMQRQGNLSRSMSIRSMQSVGRGADIFGDFDPDEEMLQGFSGIDIFKAVEYLSDPDPSFQSLGAAFIQHECYNTKESKDEVREHGGIPELVKLFSSDNQEVRRFATGAARNLIYENAENKAHLIGNGGIAELVKALKIKDDNELAKNITGILWNLSAKEEFKKKLAEETLDDLTNSILVPLTTFDEDKMDVNPFQETPSNSEIFLNSTGCLRNLSSGKDSVRKKMRETRNLVDSLVRYTKFALLKNLIEEKGMENTMCILRNLSYQLYSDLPPSLDARLNGNTRDQGKQTQTSTVGCFTPRSKKAQKKSDTRLVEIIKEPKDVEWLCNTKILSLYLEVLRECEINSTVREATLGALQNITSGDSKWASVLSSWLVKKEQKSMYTLLDLTRGERDSELRPLTGLFNNLSRKDYDNFDKAAIKTLLNKLPEDATKRKGNSSEVAVNILATLNNVVVGNIDGARNVLAASGLEKLMTLKKEHGSSADGIKIARAAATVLSNMYVYKQLRSQLLKSYEKDDFKVDDQN
ncbi:plakophilin-3 isoform X2 [Nothobranchius furzeri]|uniref:Plakophilin 3 n=1 Tax=Nothobranchius furzeri TaxID=105023 RepID=A0A8C6Q1G6_NOTFU|nr:plakophilin-3a isoform X2 [Nothobranchius furzeri]KAF7224263.1 plakophilin 3 [Nothobranchius furzeri]